MGSRRKSTKRLEDAALSKTSLPTLRMARSKNTPGVHHWLFSTTVTIFGAHKGADLEKPFCGGRAAQCQNMPYWECWSIATSRRCLKAAKSGWLLMVRIELLLYICSTCSRPVKGLKARSESLRELIDRPGCSLLMSAFIFMGQEPQCPEIQKVATTTPRQQ